MAISLYHRFPWALQEVAVSLEGYRIQRRRYGPMFHRLLHEYESRAAWPAESMVAYHHVQLASTLHRAAGAPFYGELFQRLDASWHDFLEPKAFAQLPIITKSDLHERGQDFETRAPQKGDSVISTSGTTGTSLSLAVSGNVDLEQWAVWWRYRRSHGISLGTPLALFASTPIAHAGASGRFWRHNYGSQETRYSVYHLRPETAAHYVENLNIEGKPWIHGNPSAIALLATLMIQQDLTLDFTPKWITTGSENLTANFRTSIQNAFGVAPTQHYGLAEANANFSECPSREMHVDEDYAHVEFVPQAGDAARIIGTSFTNQRTAILRYDTGDLATLRSNSCACGRPGRLLEAMDGRQGDYVTLPSGARVASLASPFHATNWLSEGQLYQDPTGAVEVRYVPRAHAASTEQLFELERKLRLRVGNELVISFRQVTQVPRSDRGKTRLVVSDYHPLPAK